MRAFLLATFLALVLAVPTLAQDTALPDEEPRDPKGVLSAQRLEATNKGMAYAAERLDNAAEGGENIQLRDAFDESRQSLRELRQLVRPLSESERSPFEAAAAEAEVALGGGDPRAGAEAMRTLRQRMLDLLAARG